MDIQSCLIKLGYSAVVWSNSYDGIKPHELETKPIPTLSELEAVWPEVETELKIEEVRRNRAQEYPPMADYLDGIVKGDTAQVQKYIDDCLAVKAKYPKE